MFSQGFFLPAIILSKTLTTHLQTRSFARAPFTNKLGLYLRQAQLIDSIRLTLRSNTSISPSSLLNDRLLDPFVVTHALRSAPNADSALSIIEALKSNPTFSHNQSTLHALATVLAKSQRNDELRTLITDVSSGRFKNIRFSFMNLMQWFSTSGDLELVLNTWNEYRRSEELLSTESYNIVMRVYANSGKNFQAVEILRKMIDEGAIPNSRTYTVMIEHLVKLGKLDSAVEIFRVLPLMRIKRTLKQYLILVEGFVGVERFDEVKILLIEMRDDGKFPGRAMRVVLEHLQDLGFIEETDEFLREMLPDKRIKSFGYCEDSNGDDDEDENDDNSPSVEIVSGVRLKPWLDPKALANSLSEWSPEVVSLLVDAHFLWTTRLVCKVLRNFKLPETAWCFFCWVANQPGYTHDVYALERMMTILARHGQVELVDRLLAKIRSDGLRLPFSALRLIIDFYGISKKPDAALKVFHDRTLCGPISKFNLMLLYSSLLRTLTKCKRDLDAINVLEEMILSGIVPDVQTFTGMMYHFSLQGDIKVVQKLFSMVRQSGVEPDAYMLKVLIQAYCKCKRAPLAYRVFEDLSNSNPIPDAATKQLLVKSLWKEGRRIEAATVEERWEKINAVLPLALRGHIWTVSYADLTRVYNIYSNSITSTAS